MRGCNERLSTLGNFPASYVWWPEGVASICISSCATKKLTHCCVMAQPPSRPCTGKLFWWMAWSFIGFTVDGIWWSFMGLVNIPSIDIAYGTSPFLNDKLSTDGPVSHGYGLFYQRIQAEVFPSADPEFLEFPTLLKLVTDDSGCLNPKFGLYVYIYIYWKNIATGSHKNVKIQRTQTWRFSKCCCLISILHFSEFQSWCLLRVVHLPLPSWARLGLRRWTLFRSNLLPHRKLLKLSTGRYATYYDRSSKMSSE